MGSVTNQVSTNNQLFNDFDKSFIFLRDNKFDKATFINTTGATVTLAAGTLVGRISASGNITEHASGATGATAGAEYPIGVLAQDIEVGAGATLDNVTFCIGGEVAREKIAFNGSDDFDTVVSGKILEDRIAADSAGIVLIETDELTEVDNS